MVIFKNAKVTIYEEVASIDNMGDTVSEYTEVETIIGDVQPHTLTQDEMKLYGISESKGNVKLFLYNGLHASVKTGARAKVKSNFTQSEEMYTVMPCNAWSRHGECLLVPVENER